MHHRHDVAQFVLRKQEELVGVPVIPFPFLCLPPYVFCGHRTVGVLCQNTLSVWFVRRTRLKLSVCLILLLS